jgi:hypothetical protein
MSQTKAQLIDGKGSVDLGALSISGSAADNSVNIDSSSRLLVGTSSARSFVGTERLVQIEGTSSSTTNLSITRNSNDSGSGNLFLGKSRGTANGSNTIVQSGDGLGGVYFNGTDGTQFVIGAFIACEVDGTPGANDMPGRLVFTTTADGASSPTERMRIDSSGRLLVGTSSALTGTDTQYSRMVVTGNTSGASAAIMSLSRPEAATSITTDEVLGLISFADNGAGEYARITCAADANAGSGDYPGRLVFSTTADGASSPTERMRISNNGDILFNTTTTNTFFSGGRVLAAGDAQFTRNGATALTLRRMTSDGTIATFIPDNGNIVGTISVTSSATAYNTSSDYRLKENVVALTGAIDRINQLQVHRFNFIADPEKTVDGFIAHEAQAVVPECVTGAKDKVDADGNPVYQGIDQSKLVPLLTAALQEALAEIESLKARVSALEP